MTFGDEIGIALFAGLVGAYFLGTLAFAAFVMRRLGHTDLAMERLEGLAEMARRYNDLLEEKGDKGATAMVETDEGGEALGLDP